MLVLILLTDIDPHLLQEESKTCPRDSKIWEKLRGTGNEPLGTMTDKKLTIAESPKHADAGDSAIFGVVGESQNEARRQLPPRFVLPVPLRHVVINYLVIVHLDRLLVLAEQRPHQI